MRKTVQIGGPADAQRLIEILKMVKYDVVTTRHNATESRAAGKTSASLQTIYVTTKLAGYPTRVFAFSQRTNELKYG